MMAEQLIVTPMEAGSERVLRTLMADYLAKRWFESQTITVQAHERSFDTAVSRFVVGDVGVAYPYFNHLLFALPWHTSDSISEDTLEHLSCCHSGLAEGATSLVDTAIELQQHSSPPSKFNMVLLNYFNPAAAQQWHADDQVCLFQSRLLLP